MEPIRTGFSMYIFDGDGVTNTFPLQFTLGELKRSYITCQVADEVDGLGNPVYRELIEVPGDPSMIQIAGAVPAVGDKIEFRRVVPKDLLLHLYANGSILDYPSLDESHLQLMMALHEVLDGVGLKNVYTDINMHGYKITNVFSDPDDPDSMATVAFLGTYRQDALDAAVAAADSALEALGYKNAARVLAIQSGASANDSAASASVAQAAATNAANDTVALLSGYVADAQAAKSGAELAEDGAQAAQLAAEAISTEAAARAYNYIINGNFDIWQRGTNQTIHAYGSDDRWVNGHMGSTKTHSRQPFSVGEIFPDGRDCPSFYSRTMVTSVAGVSNHCYKSQKIEFVSTLAGKKALLSFYAKASSSKSLAIEFAQGFGNGGSPSPSLEGIGVQKVELTTSWQRFSVVVDLPSIAGKVIGTNNDSNLQVLFWFDAGTNFNSRTDSLGHQSGTFDIACVSLVEGDVDVKPIPRSYGEELALCQRYFEGGHTRVGGYSTAGTNIIGWCSFAVKKRASPVMSRTFSGANYTTASTTTTVSNGFAPYLTVAATGYATLDGSWEADAEL